MKTIKLGDIVKDVITGFTGVVCKYVEYPHNCPRLAIQPRELKDDLPQEMRYFDITHMELVEKGVIKAAKPVQCSFAFGDKVTHNLSSLTGVVTSLLTDINGCMRVGVQSREMKDGLPVDELWITPQDLTLVTPVAVPQAEPCKTGGPMKNPVLRYAR